MASDSYIKALAQQQGVGVTSDGAQAALRMSRTGSLFTADWKSDLILRGLAYNVTVGGISAGGDVSLVTGGGDGTTVDTDQPEMHVQTPTGYFHVPLAFRCAIQADPDADADEQNIILFADTAMTSLVTGATATTETPANLLDGGNASVSSAISAVTGDITDPTCSILLDFATTQAAQITAASTVIHELRMDYNAPFPIFLKGPCAVVAAFGGTAAVTGAATYFFAEIPVAQVE